MKRLDRLAQVSLIFIGAITLIFALSLGKTILPPLTLALVAGVVLSPLSDFWEDRGYSPVWGALIGLVGTLLVMAALVFVFQPVVIRLVEQAPRVWADIREIVEAARGFVRGVSREAGEAVSTAAGTTAEGEGGEEGVQMPTVTDALLVAPAVLSQIVIFIGTLFFFLLTRSQIYDWLSLRLSRRGERAELAVRLRLAERNVSRYFLTITMINAGLGTATAIMLQLLGVPNAIVLGVVAFLANFVVYLGPAIFFVVLLFVGVAEFDGILSLAPGVAFLGLNATEAQFVTPGLVGRHMQVNPLLVFLSLVFGLWLWGPIGGIVAIPLLLWVMVLSQVTTKPFSAAKPA
ncbi:Predicted PurR-regulated permease PerM [Cribrihabitans marinus]|uniref:Predicted PurR-regulated permease PerM n=1 Tax=Cribrihabitans marinus TaxID=1227549 RepID=A0A1H7BGD2_9RHOB|nr:AI-2E family transporter [Cribrihabitans marinus]SEJ76004.1 Predicted PurR-regulated permease PerM [Cribrihabitans marinus]